MKGEVRIPLLKRSHTTVNRQRLTAKERLYEDNLNNGMK